MRIRSTKPEFWRSRTVASVDWDARLVLKGLESYVDDNGVGKDDIALVVGDVFPRDMLASPRETVARVSEAIGSLHRAGLIWRYEVDGTPLLYVSSWESVQRIDKPGKGRLPRPDGTLDYGSSIIRESVASPRETLAPGTGEQGNRGTGENNSRPAEPDTFDEWWASWPRKEAKAKARQSYKAALKVIDAPELLRLTAAWFAARPGLEAKFTPQAASWLNARRWEDEAPTGTRAAKPVGQHPGDQLPW